MPHPERAHRWRQRPLIAAQAGLATTLLALATLTGPVGRATASLAQPSDAPAPARADSTFRQRLSQRELPADDYWARLRALLVHAAERDEPLTPFDVLGLVGQLGTQTGVAEGSEALEGLRALGQQTQDATAAVERQYRRERTQSPPLERGQLPPAREQGSSQFERRTLALADSDRQRSLPTTLYLPQRRQREAPLVVLSHGLGADRASFAYLAQHLASYGFAVAALEHPGSNSAWLESLLNGDREAAIKPGEALERPRDVTFLLDRLARDYGQRIDTQRVGIVGHSFGGYTALALTEAKLNFEQLERRCRGLGRTLNISLLLQCQLQQLPQQDYGLQDERIAAVVAVNPFASAVFGESQLQRIETPTLIVSSTEDTITPALAEQIRPFSWLSGDDRYLALMQGATHFSVLPGVGLPRSRQRSEPEAPARQYLKSLSTAFLRARVAGDSDYRDLMGARYAQRLRQSAMPLFVVRSLERDALSPEEGD